MRIDINKYILFIKGNYKVTGFENIKGLESLWEIAFLCKDTKVKEDSIYLLASLHLNLDPNRYEIEQKKDVWKIFVDKCLESLKSQDKNVINSAVLALIRFFDIFDGKSLNQTDSNQGSCFPVHVYCADDGVKKAISIPYSENLLYLRKAIAEQFDIGINDFQIIVNMKQLDEEDNETLIRDIGFSVIYVIRKNQTEKSGDHPKNILVGNHEFFDLMFVLLAHDEDYDVDNIWKLLMKLPQDEVPTAQKLDQLEINEDNEWEELIDGHSLHKLLYSLQIIITKSKKQDTEWMNKFLALNGYSHLFKTFLQIDVTKVNSNLSFKSINILCSLICEAMQENPGILTQFREHTLASIDKIIHLMHRVTQLSIENCQKRGSSYDEIFYKNKEIERNSMRLLSYYEKSKSENEQEEQNEYSRKLEELNGKFDEVGKFISICLKLLFLFDLYTNEDCISRFTDYPYFTELILETLFETDNFYIRNNFGDGLSDILCNQNNELSKFIEFKRKIIHILVYEIDEQMEKDSTRIYKATAVLTKALAATKSSFLTKTGIDFEEVIQRNVKLIMERESTEKSSTDFDNVLNRSLQIVKILVQQFPHYKEKYGKILLHYLLKECMFEVPTSNRSKNSTRPPKCKNSSTRTT